MKKLNILKSSLNTQMHYLKARFLKSFLFLSSVFYLRDIVLANDNLEIEWMAKMSGEHNDYIVDVVDISGEGIFVLSNNHCQDSLHDSSYIEKSEAYIYKLDDYGNQIWKKAFGEYPLGIKKTANNHLILMGADIELGLYIIEINSDGDEIWSKKFAWSDNIYRTLNSFEVTSSDEIIIIGDAFNPSSDSYSFIVKLDFKGDELWRKKFKFDNYSEFLSINETSDEGFIIAGRKHSVERDSSDALLIKCDKNGNEEWIKTFFFEDKYDGIFSASRFNSAIETKNQSIVAVGATNTFTGLYYEEDGKMYEIWEESAYIVKCDKNGNLLWSKVFGGEDYDWFYSVMEDMNGELVAFGGTFSPDILGFSPDYYYGIGVIVRYGEDGDFISVQSFQEEELLGFGYPIEKSDGSIILATGLILPEDKTDCEYANTQYLIVKFSAPKSDAEKAVEKAVQTKLLEDIKNARNLVNLMPDSLEKDNLQRILNDLMPIELSSISLGKSATSNIDVYIISVSSISLSLVNSSISFEDFSGVEDVVKSNALSFVIDSSLGYNASVSLVGDIVSSDGNVLDKSIFNIKSSLDNTYSNYISTNELKLFKNQSAGNNKTHNIDIMLKGGISHIPDVYKTVLKVEVEQI